MWNGLMAVAESFWGLIVVFWVIVFRDMVVRWGQWWLDYQYWRGFPALMRRIRHYVDNRRKL